MTPPSILLDAGFLRAVTDPGADEHQRAVRAYRQLLEDHDAGRRWLRARHDHLELSAGTQRNRLFAPVDAVHVAGQHRRAAAVTTRDLGTTVIEIDDDLAISVVLLDRERIRAVATFDRRFTAIDVEVLPAAEAVPAGDVDYCNPA